MFLSKKGVAMTVIVAIIVIAFIVVSGFFVKNLYAASREGLDRSLCGTQIQLASAKNSILKLGEGLGGEGGYEC